METRATDFAAVRPLLIAIAYRMLGSVMDAEDVVQEAYLRWQEAPDVDVRSPQAYLTTIVTRLSINHLRSARVQRETYIGPWLPEPVVTAPDADPQGAVELAESLSMAFLVLLERLSPVERAVFLLREVFDFEYDEIARIVDKTPANCRQLFTRAKKHVGAPRARFAADSTQAQQLMERFAQAAGRGDLDGLLALLAEDITVWADGGGKAEGAARKPVHGADAVARFTIGAIKKFTPVIRPARVNGQPGFVAYHDDKPVAAMVCEIRDGRIQNMYVVSNPDKLKNVPAVTTP